MKYFLLILMLAGCGSSEDLVGTCFFDYKKNTISKIEFQDGGIFNVVEYVFDDKEWTYKRISRYIIEARQYTNSIECPAFIRYSQ